MQPSAGGSDPVPPSLKRLRMSDTAESAGGSGGGAGTIAAPALLPAPVDSEAREEVFQNEDLMKQVFQQLCLEDLCKAGMVRRRWREITNNPAFWRLIDLEGKPLTVSKVCHLLSKHCGVYVLKARKVRFARDDLPSLLPRLTCLRSLELEKPSYEERELDALSHLPSLTRLLLAGGFVGGSHVVPPAHAWANPGNAQQETAALAHTGLQQLTLESGRTGRLAIRAPRLSTLVLRDFMWGQLQLHGATSLSALSVLDCGKLADSSLRNLLCLEGPHAAPLPALTSLKITHATLLSDETLRLVGQRHPAVASLHVEGCAAVAGRNLGAAGAFGALRALRLEGCDMLGCANLAASVQAMPGLESLSVLFCPQLTGLQLQCSHLTRLAMQGNRNLQELTLRCARLAHVELSPQAPGMASAHELRRISLSSYAVESLHWSAFPALEEVTLQCVNLLELDLSECGNLRDSVFHSLCPGGAVGVPGFTAAAAGGITPGCPRLRNLKLSYCDSLRNASLSSPSLESLQLSHCKSLQRVALDCPALQRLGLEECTELGAVTLATQRMQAMSLGTCPHLESISIDSPSIAALDLRGCNSLRTLSLACPALRSVDATFCGALPDSAMAAVARCPALQDLTLAVCNSLTARGLTVLSALSGLQSLDLSYMPLEDPRPIYSACLRLTSLTISNNYLLEPAHLLELLPPAGGGPGARGPLRELVALDVSYCEVPTDVLEELIVRGGRQLEQLAISGCSGVTDELMLRLHRRAAAAGAPVGTAREGSSEEGAAALRSLSMVGSKALRHVHLGLMPAAVAAAHGCCAAAPAPGALAAPGAEAGPSGSGSQGQLSQPAEECVAVDTLLPALEELRFGMGGVRTVAIGLPSLSRLQLFSCSEMRHLELDCPRLEKLSVQACKRLPLESLVGVLRGGCPSVTELDVQYYSGADACAVPALRAACPSLRQVLVTAPHHRL